MRLALLGAESTGKTRLAAGLAQRLQAQGHTVRIVSEVLREWCDRAGRTPRPEEQEAIAHEQARRVLQANDAGWVIADTTPMMVAVYSDLLFGDTSLYQFACIHQRCYDITLVTGLDLPWIADGLQRDGPHVQEPVDALLRSALKRAGIGFHVIYGHGAERLDHAMAAIAAIAGTDKQHSWRVI